MWRRVGVLALVAALSACASLQQGPLGGAVARLESATVRNSYDASPSSADVRILRGANVVRASAGTALNLGDTIITSSDARVVLEFAVGYEVVMDTGTTISIEAPTPGESGSGDAGYASLRQAGATPYALRPAYVAAPRFSARVSQTEASGKVVTIFLRLGQAFVRRLLGRSDTLNTATPQALVQAHGTEYLISVSSTATTIRVAEDAVDVTPRTGNFPRVTYTKYAGGVIANGAPARRMPPVSQPELDQELAWVRQYDRITKIVVPPLDSLTETLARATLARVGLKVLLVTHRTTGRAAPERVVDYSPGAGQQVAPGTYINLVLEKTVAPRTPGAAGGDRVTYCTVPQLVAQSAQAALKLLDAAHLKGQPSGSARGANYVSGQQEAAGSRVACNSVIHYSLVAR